MRTLSWAPGSPTHLLSWVPGFPIQLRPLGWASGAAAPEKVPAISDFAGTFFDAKSIETHRGSFYCIIWLDAGTFSNKISYRPANKLKWTREQAQGHCPVCLYSDSQHWFRSQLSEFPVTTGFTFILQKLHSYMIEASPRQGLYWYLVRRRKIWLIKKSERMKKYARIWKKEMKKREKDRLVAAFFGEKNMRTPLTWSWL